jgi:site-specific DNA-cytosine methylase
MEHSADSRLTETEITELTEIFIKVYDDGAYDVEEGTKTPSQRKQAKCQFKKTIKNDMKKMSKYYMCIFRTVLEADLARLSQLRRRVREVKREKEELIKNLEVKKQCMETDLRKEIRDDLRETEFKEQSEQNERLKKRYNEQRVRIEQLNKQVEELQMDSRTWVERSQFNTLQNQYYELLKETNKKKAREKTQQEKDLEKKRKRLEQLKAEEEAREKEKADLMAELECDSDDEPEEINISLTSSDED